VTDPEADAERLLQAAWVGRFGEMVLPVDPVRIAKDLGIDVFVAPMERDVSGVLVKRPGADAVIYLNEVDHSNRQRFTCGHELGHYVRRTEDGKLDYEFVDRRDKLAQSGTDPDEIYANRFAAALLMPADVIRRLHRDSTAVELAYLFKVSEEAMKFRLANLQLR
jgi:IrrE N-terminal-like domain